MNIKKVLATVCCMSMMASLVACGNGGDSSTSKSEVSSSSGENTVLEIPAAAKENITKYLTDNALDSKDIIMTINGVEIPASYFLYWTSSVLSDYSSYGSKINMSDSVDENTTVGENILSKAQSDAIYYVILNKECEQRGLTLTDEQQEELENYLNSLDENTLLYYATNLDDQKIIYTTYLYNQLLQPALFGEGGEYEITDENVNELIGDRQYYTIDYLYFGNEDGVDDAAEQSMEKAKAALANLEGLSDNEFAAAFATESQNATYHQEDYTSNCSDEDDSALSDAMTDIAIGTTSVVQNDYGTFVIHRNELDMDSIKQQLSNEKYYAMIDEWAAEADVQTNENYDKFDIDSFYTKLSDLQSIVLTNMNAASSYTTPEPDTSNNDSSVDVSVNGN